MLLCLRDFRGGLRAVVWVQGLSAEAYSLLRDAQVVLRPRQVELRGFEVFLPERHLLYLRADLRRDLRRVAREDRAERVDLLRDWLLLGLRRFHADDDGSLFGLLRRTRARAPDERDRDDGEQRDDRDDYEN